MPIRRVGRPGLMGTMARTAVVAGTATAVSGAVNNKQQQKYAAQQDAAAQQAAGLTDDAMEQLKKLGDLKAAGVLSDEEFAAAKAKILGI
jgi:membrane protease subunit (stomatin/prohibitin family)